MAHMTHTPLPPHMTHMRRSTAMPSAWFWLAVAVPGSGLPLSSHTSTHTRAARASLVEMMEPGEELRLQARACRWGPGAGQEEG